MGFRAESAGRQGVCATLFGMVRRTREAFAIFFLAGCASEPAVTPGVVSEDTGVVDAVTSDSEVAPFPVQRVACLSTGALAHDLPSEQMGALEGELVSIVPPGVKGCPSDPDHLHLQIAVGSKRYDVAVTIDSDFGAPIALHAPKRAVSPLEPEGWSVAKFDYSKNLGTPSADYQALGRDALLARLQSELATAARVRVFGESYADGSGLHKVHRNGRGGDGAILVRHVDGGDKVIALRFATDVF